MDDRKGYEWCLTRNNQMSNSSVGHHAPQICFKFGSCHSRNQHGVQFSRASRECHPAISANARNFPEDLQCHSLRSFTARQCAAARQPVAPRHDASRQVKNSPCPPLEGRLQPRGCGVYKPVTQWFVPAVAGRPTPRWMRKKEGGEPQRKMGNGKSFLLT